MVYTEQTEKYFKNLEKEIRIIYDKIREARKKGFDSVSDIEIPLAKSMAEKVVGLISVFYPQLKNSGVAKRIFELEKEYGKLNPAVSFKIAEEIAKQKFCQFESLLQSIEVGIRVGFAYLTLGVVSSPIEGFTRLKLGKTKKGEDYFVAYFSGPIRSAGTTAGCLALMLIDYLRELFGYVKYDPTDEEVKRYITENTDYHERITNLQYFPTSEEMEFLASNLPIQIDGEPTEKLEVSNHKNLERIETDYIRGGMCLIFSEGLAQKAAKGFRFYKELKEKGFKLSGFDFLDKYLELHKKRDKGNLISARPTYINDLVAGRPIFGHPSKSGGFRFRYGRGRVNGFSAVSLNPKTMAILDEFIAIGTQLKLEKPTKGCVVTSCDVIEGPIVKLKNGSVKKINSIEEAKLIYSDVEEIIYLGDILFPFSDVLNRNADLIKPGYVQEWWFLDLKEKNNKENLNYFDVSFEKAIELSKKYDIPLHPDFIFYWNQINLNQFFSFINWLELAKVDGKIIFPYGKNEQEKFESGKRALEILGIEHLVTIENIVLDEKESKKLLLNLGLDLSILNEKVYLKKFIKEKNLNSFEKLNKENSVLDIINAVSEFKIKDKAGDFIGSRMGRPEKAKLRKLSGSPNTLFPVGFEGGRLRSVQTACEIGKIDNYFPFYFCEKCNHETIYPICENCGSKCKKKFYFSESREKSFNKFIEDKEGLDYYKRPIDINYYFKKAIENLNLNKNEIPPLIKGVRGTSSKGHIMENLSKGVLRAKNNLQVNKDGSIRYDCTELPLNFFKPKEIKTSVEKLRELGYKKDINGNSLVNEEQILELMPHDVLLPNYVNAVSEKADDVFINICNFVDELLEKFYKINPIHNIKIKEDLIGQLGVCMAPHNCAGVICRFIGFADALGLYASPYMHAAIRRDCDGDEAALMLLSDVLLNFSKSFLPEHRGGTQDAPLVLNYKIDAGEVDDQILDFEVVENQSYPLELYSLAEKRKHSSEVKSIKTIKTLLKEDKDPFEGLGFTHDSSDFNKGIKISNYKTLATMAEKVQHQMDLVEKIRAVDVVDTAKLIIERHFIRDIKGNLRKFSIQGFRCVSCNQSFRRPPLKGICPFCGGKIIFTIHEGGIKKYLDIALELTKKYKLSPYIKQTIELTKETIDSIFGKELEKQEALGKWF
jgi:DNA polymerase II large subunit